MNEQDVGVFSVAVSATLTDTSGVQLKTITKTFKVTFTAVPPAAQPETSSASVAAAVASPFVKDLVPVILELGNSTTWQLPEMVANKSE